MIQNPIDIMIQKYNCKSLNDYTNALKEIIQEIALLALWRSKFFEKASFYGGTALRIFHQLNRFSEDLDFSLLKNEPRFKLEKYNEAIRAELHAFGFDVEIIAKEKKIPSNIDSIILKANSKLQFLNVAASKQIIDKIHHQEKISIKMEVDIDPPLNFNTESKILLNPIPFNVNTFQLPDLFATKIHAILCRSWQTRVKGRDWFDLIWYISRSIPLSIKHLETRLIKTSAWDKHNSLHEENIIDLLQTKINKVDFELAKQDVRPFIYDLQSLELWSESFFQNLLSKITFVNT